MYLVVQCLITIGLFKNNKSLKKKIKFQYIVTDILLNEKCH